MRDITDELARYGKAVGQAVGDLEAEAEPADRAASSRGSRRKVVLGLVAAALVLLPLGAALWLGARNDGGDRVAPVDSESVDAKTPAGWTLSEPGPLPARERSATVWTGEELIIWGGGPADDGSAVDDGSDEPPAGAAYDPVDGTWRRLAPGPLAPGPATGVWAGDEVLIWRIPELDVSTAPWKGAAWNPATDTWRRLEDAPPPPEGDVSYELVWLEHVVVAPGLNASYEPVADTWVALPPPPTDGLAIAAAPLGSELVVLRSPEGTVADTLAAYDPPTAAALDLESRQWRALDSPPIETIGASLETLDDRLLALDYSMHSATYFAGDGRWLTQDGLPLRFFEGLPSTASFGRRAVVLRSGHVALFDTHEGWALDTDPPVPVANLVAADDAVLGLSGDRVVQYRPPEFVAGRNLAPSGTFPLGVLSMDLPTGTVLTGLSRVELLQGGVAVELGFRLSARSRSDCLATSTYLGLPADDRITRDAETDGGVLTRFDLDPIVPESSPSVLSAEFEPGTRSDRAHVLIAATGSDVVEITCDSLERAGDLAARLSRPE